jgi:hypothetical protein
MTWYNCSLIAVGVIPTAYGTDALHSAAATVNRLDLS